MVETIIDMRGICRTYELGGQELKVLRDVDFQVQKGEFVAVLGPSGSGKSTLMNILGCMDKANTGEYYLSGNPVHKLGEEALARIRNENIGFVFQKYHLIPQYSVVQNIIMPLLVRGISHREAIKTAMPVIEMLGMNDRMIHKPRELSGGQQQRVAIARALVGNPGILLADEPTGALDSSTGRDVLELFEKINENGNTIIMITHDLNVAKSAKRVVNIVDGELYA